MKAYCLAYEPCSVLCASLDGRGFGGEPTHVHVRLSPSSSPETVTTWLVGCSPIQSLAGVKNLKKQGSEIKRNYQ